jgi:hypothetical protein
MKTKLLISVATAALIAGTAGALAQQEEKGGAPAGAAPGAAQHQMAPGGAGGAMHGATPGAGAQNQMKPQGGMSEQKSVQGNPSEERGKAGAEQGEKGNAQERAQTQPGGKTDEKAQTEDRNKTQENAQSQDRNKTQENAQGNTQERGAAQQNAQGKASGGKSVQLSETQRTQIKSVVGKDRNFARVDHVDFSINVGVAVPRTVQVAVLPTDIVELVPEYRGFDYVVVGDQLLIIDPNTMLIVEVLPV